MINIAIITAAGSGKRLPGTMKKQFINIAGRPLLFWTIDPFLRHQQIHKIIITLPSDDFVQVRDAISQEFGLDRIQCVKGGKERQNSVYNALQACPKETAFVLIHDGVRPFITSNDISELLELVKGKKALIPVSHVNNTVKTVADGKVIETISRKDLYHVFTPQVFEYNTLKTCHEKIIGSDQIFTDDASILEFFDIPVYAKIVGPWNIKITEPEDIKIAELILSKGDRR
jgi:2-C-methyl-D-erythritol 4-phosphate cytidylyltransferase